MGNFKGSKGKWELDSKSIFINDKLMVTCWSENSKHLDERLKGESWLDMRNRTREDRCLLNEYIPKANALLISKAPEMLEMLESITLTWDSNGNFDNEYFNNIKQLIKEATEI